ncbi:hypothetical protein EC968_004658 [Mortierella alpina]|nr:hypothetical protein EC968_004658 [Mortierella alpina]
MSAKLGSTAPSPSIANLASKVISRLASNNINLGPTSLTHSNINNNSSNSSNSFTNHNNNNNSSSNTHSVADEDEGSIDNDEDDEDAGIIRCICNYTDDDGFTIQCERCFVWQHAVCVGIVQSNVPDKYLCELCSPRPVDRKRANEIQRRRNGTVERRREKSPSRRKSSVGRPRKQFGAGGSNLAEQALVPASSSSSSAALQHGSNPGAGSTSGSNGHLSKSAAGSVDSNGKRSKGAHSSSASNPSQPTSSSTLSNSHSSTKQRSAGQPNSSRTPVTNEDDDLDMESDSQEDVLDAYQFEFSPVETNIVMSKAVQDLFRQVIAQFRQAQSRKRSLSLTSGVKLQELVGSNPAGSALSNSSTPSAADSPDASSTTLASQPPQPTGPTLSTDASNVVSMERESLARPLMKTTVKHILPSSRLSHSPVPQYGLFAETNIGMGRFMMEFKGEVSLKSSYKTDPINQYAILATPKPFVLFHPQLNLVVDARRCGNDARFVRRSCVPNTEVKSIVVPGVQDQTVHLGLFAKIPVAKGEEITLDWDWNKEHLALQAIKPLAEKSKDSAARKSQKEVRKAKHLVASTLLAQTDCACENKDTCLLHQMLRDGLSEPGTRHPDPSPSPSAAKGSRPKKVAAESLRQRYGSQRERSEADDQDGKRFADPDTSDEEISVAESSPRRKSPKASKPESASKKARHEVHPNPNRTRAEQYPTSDSDSDDNRKRKQKLSDRQSSPSKRSSSINQEMSAREMKQALMLIKKMEDKDAGLAGNSKQKNQETGSKDTNSSQTQRRSGITSPKSRPRDKNKPVDINKRSVSPQKTINEEDNISIGDSGIDSDSNNGLLRREPGTTERSATSANKRLQAVQAQGKRDREQMEHDESVRSPATSDSERREGGGRFAKRPPLPSQLGKKQPYATASRERRMTEHPDQKQRPKDRRRAVDPVDDSQNLSGSSSVESSFVSVVGNTSDEEDEADHRLGRRLLREKNMPKETLPVASLKPSVLPCKKVWKMIYMKQRAVAEEEAREKAEEMRKKAEEVFDLKMEEDEPVINNSNAPSAAAADPTPDATLVEADSMENSSVPSPRKTSPPLSELQSSIIEGDVLNLFHKDVKPESHSSTASKNRHAYDTARAAEATVAPAPIIQQPVVIKPANLHQPPVGLAATPSSTDPSKVPQKMSLESYQARKLTSTSPAPSEAHKTTSDHPSSAAAVVGESTTPQVPESMDLDVLETSAGISSGDELPPKAELPAAIDAPAEMKREVAPTVPKVKLSLQEYQKQRQEASQRTVSTPSIETPSESKTESLGDTEPKDEHGVGQDMNAVSAQKPVHESEDVEMTEAPADSAMDVAEQEPPAHGDYFEVGTSLPTPLIGLSSRAHAGAQPSGDYFPVQPFSPTSLSAGPTPFAKMNLAASPPPRTPATSDAQATGSPTKSPGVQRPPSSPSAKQPQSMSLEIKSPGSKLGTSPPQNQGPSGWRTPRSQRGTSPQSLGSSGAPVMNYRGASGLPVDTRLTSPRFYGSPSDRSERLPAPGPLASPTRERQHSTASAQPSSPFDSNFSNASGHYGYSEDMASFKRPGPLSSPTGSSAPTGAREYYKPDERSRHRSMNSDEWGYGNVDPVAYGGYRGPRGAPPPPPRDRDRDRDRDREREREHERERERERRERYDRRGDYFASGPSGTGGGSGGIPGNSPGFYGPSRGPGGSIGMGGGAGGGAFGRRPSDYYGNHAREGGYIANNSSSGGAGGGFAGNNSSKKEGALDSPSLSGSGAAFAGGQGGYLAENNANTSASSNSNNGRRM